MFKSLSKGISPKVTFGTRSVMLYEEVEAGLSITAADEGAKSAGPDHDTRLVISRRRKATVFQPRSLGPCVSRRRKMDILALRVLKTELAVVPVTC